MLFLRTCKKDGTSRNGYKWDLTIGAINIAQDWQIDPNCGEGLYGLPEGRGKGLLLDWSEDAIGVVFSSDEWVRIDERKGKVQQARIEFTGTIKECADYIHNITRTMNIVGHEVNVPDMDLMLGGDFSVLTGGKGSRLIGGLGAIVSGDIGSVFSLYYRKENYYGVKTAYVGEGIIKPNCKYFLNEFQRFQEVKEDTLIYPPKINDTQLI